MKIIINGEAVEVSGEGTGGGVPKGTIVIWSGAATAIPSGWALCDGQNGTPDLRDKFVVGAGAAYDVDTTGGEAAHTLTEGELPAHSHIWHTWNTGEGGTNAPVYPIQNSKGSLPNDLSTSVVGESQPHNNLPPYYALCYIMKITNSVDGSCSSEEVYSTEETRIGTWVNGQPIYRKTFTFVTDPVLSADFQTVINWTSDMDVLVRGYGSITTQDNVEIPIPFYIDSASFVSVYYNKATRGKNPNRIFVKGSSIYASCRARYTFEYTKTTDEAVL